MNKKIVRITTVASTMNVILKGQLKYLSEYYEVVGITSDFDNYLNEISQREGVRIINLKFSRNISLLNDLISLIRLILILIREKPIIVHSQTPKAGLIAMLASFFTNVPVRLHSVVGIPMFDKTIGLKRFILIITEKITYKAATRIYPNSHGVRSYIVQNKLCKPNKLGVIGQGSSNGIDLDYFNPVQHTDDSIAEFRQKFGINQNDLVFCFVGRLVKDKGLVELAEAFFSLKEKYKNIKLFLVGPNRSSDDPLPNNLIEKLKNDKSIILTGLQKDIRPYLMASDVFVFPSYREGLPGALLQACAMGKACIATDIAGCNEIISHNINGLLIKPKSTTELNSAMELFTKNPNLIAQLAQNARTVITEKYEQKFYWCELLKEYDLQIKKCSKR